jgi:hypothetical protein
MAMNNLPLGITNIFLGVSLFWLALNPVIGKVLSGAWKIPLGYIRAVGCTIGSLCFVVALYILTGW